MSPKSSELNSENLKAVWVDVQVKHKFKDGIKVFLESGQLAARSNGSNFSSVLTDKLMACLGCTDLGRLFEVFPFEITLKGPF